MMNSWPVQRIALALSWAFLLTMLGWGFSSWLQQGVQAVAFPFELDYGEGIVWEQARLLFSGSAYAPINRFPSLVFHYPPVFHAFSLALSNLSGADMLATGRAVSLVSTAITSVVAGLLIGGLVGEESGPRGRFMAGLAGTLIIFSCMPVMMWSPLMRVDMMAVMFAFLGIALGIRAIRSERLIYWSALFFVLAVYSKQTSIAAPMSLFLVLFWLRPSLAIRGLSVCLIIGAAALVGLNWVTAGGFVRHAFLYNVNRFDWERLAWIVVVLYFHAIYFIVALSVLSRLPAIAVHYAGLNSAARKSALAADSRHSSMLVLILYWMWTTLMTLAVAKSGSSVNYLLEWMCVTTLFIGLALGDAARMVTMWRMDTTRASILTTCIVPLALGVQVVLLRAFSPASYERAWTAQRMAGNEELSARIRAADGPIISDNMVILLRNNRPVVWEPAIFAQLASLGMWDEAPFVSRIQRGEFAMFITVGTRGTSVFDERYSPRIAGAMDDVYSVKETLAGYTLHLPPVK